MINADGITQPRLVSKSGFGPQWSPGGKRGSFDRTLWVMNPDGSGKHKLAAQVEPQTVLVWKPQPGSMGIASLCWSSR